MTRFALGVEYDGTRYCGWQRQRHCESVQGVVERALARVANHPVDVHCAGRTDTAVHATGQVVHFDSPAIRKPEGWVLGTNSHLPGDVAVRWARPVADDFHARFSAEFRRYRYLIRSARSRSALHGQRAWWIPERLDAALMQAAAQPLLGEHDFSAFRAAGCQSRTPVRRVAALTVRAHQHWVVVDIAANAFLMHMVRNIVGLLRHAGRGEASAGDVAGILAARDRTRSAAAAPAHGLYLSEVGYPVSSGLPGSRPSDSTPPLLPLVPDTPPDAQ